MNLGIYYIGYVTKKREYKSNSVNPFYLMINRIDGFIKGKKILLLQTEIVEC